MSVLSCGVPARTLRVSSPAIPVVLGHPALEPTQPARLSGHEGLGSLFHYELRLKSPGGLNLGAFQAADFDLNAFIGRAISCSTSLDGSGSLLPGAAGADAPSGRSAAVCERRIRRPQKPVASQVRPLDLSASHLPRPARLP